jgi:O-antigen/teichoic acid export membrane protein
MSRKEDWLIYLLADLAVRAIFGIVAAGSILLFAIRYIQYDILESPPFWFLLCALSLLTALFGPMAFQEANLRGRGSLKEVRKRSKRRR